MPYYYGTAMHANSNGSASTDTNSFSYLGLAGLRYSVQKIMAGTFVTPADNAVWLRANRSSALSTSGSAITPSQMAVDSAAATCVVKTGMTLGTYIAVPNLQLAFNQRGTAMWAAFNADESMTGVGATAPNAEIALLNQSTGTSVPLYVTGIHSE
jgi:hypothetical protein